MKNNDYRVLVLFRIAHDIKHDVKKFLKSNGLTYNEYSHVAIMKVGNNISMHTVLIGTMVPENNISDAMGRVANYIKLKHPDHHKHIHVHNIISGNESSGKDLLEKPAILKEYRVIGWG